ncbi:heparinase II/III domain-containing protein [Cellulosilyticum sp. I15G10I2]|uniref:heparinase II/III domain-containing protein n=1 Tax=Cellulosilyticum sp. I15G10I2 TaxID=1892843 RepID=UPI00085CADE0|nr:heparinase II/III family protein [Cellulosilyticum sp. I15G10I2]
MIQFSKQETGRLRQKAIKQPYIIQVLKEQTESIYKAPVLVPAEGIANWGLYYYCKSCSVHLTFNRADRFHHVCPECGAVYEGEPFDSTWWNFVNTENYKVAYTMGLMYLLSEDKSYARKVIEILTAYAKYYIDYQIHGDIPYNGPGKAEAQTLNEAIFIRNLALAYDLVEECMTSEEKELIKDRLLIPGAEFLREHRHNQIHNHEVITNSAIAVVGVLYQRDDLITFALYEKYGLLYQLEHGILEDKVWFECSFGYHFYALLSFLSFEKFALNTSYSTINHPHYQGMLEAVFNFLQPDFSLPLLNDTNYGHSSLKHNYLFEFVYTHTRSPQILKLLNEIYKEQERKNLEAFFYGVDDLPKSEPIELRSYHSDKGSGHTVLRGDDNRYLLFRHGAYGGEHDHYDRLGISYLAHGERIAPDIGTTGYGAPLHYDYYKNTGTHNTVVINEENQMPAEGKVLRFEKVGNITYIEAEVDFKKPYVMPDSFTIVQWDEKSYKNVRMVRKIAWADTYMADLFIVEGVDDYSIDWCMHFCGMKSSQHADEKKIHRFSDKKPFKYLHDVTRLEPIEQVKTSYRIGGANLNLFTYLKGGAIYYGEGPDNPSLKDMSYVIQRIEGNSAVFFNIIESYQDHETLLNVEFKTSDDKIEAIIYKKDTVEKVVFEL